MTDRELIELAAKAAGYHGVEFQKGLGLVAIGQPEKANMLFNPLESDADAFRLAVKLELTVMQYQRSVEVSSISNGVYVSREIDAGRAWETRRAITRAAAEIGKEMGK